MTDCSACEHDRSQRHKGITRVPPKHLQARWLLQQRHQPPVCLASKQRCAVAYPSQLACCYLPCRLGKAEQTCLAQFGASGAEVSCSHPEAAAMHSLTASCVCMKDVTQLYTLGKVLGKGQFGTTRVAEEKATSKIYACKSIAKRKLV